jgi:hypothetical protein
MDRLYSQMSKEELQDVMRELKEEAIALFEKGLLSEVMVLRTKYYLAASYLLDPESIEVGGVYYVEGLPDDATFTVTKVDGVMAHGNLSSSPEPQAFPIAMLSKEPTDIEP